MLEKLKGNINVDKLRAILLMEADYNFLNKRLIGRRLLSKLEEKKQASGRSRRE